VPHADLKVLDPHTNTATITLMHGHMIYDTLFAWDSKLQSKPQMVESYQISPDRLVYTFTLRSGLKFHDGQPVTTSDVIPSLKRWMGGKMTFKEDGRGIGRFNRDIKDGAGTEGRVGHGAAREGDDASCRGKSIRVIARRGQRSGECGFEPL
jgi:ABC-type transport system substrate-binding protein